MGFSILSTKGTAEYFKSHDLSEVTSINKVSEGRPHIEDAIKNGEVAMVINTPSGGISVHDSYSIRRTALDYNVPYTTTVAGAKASAEAIRSILQGNLTVKALQDYHQDILDRPIF